MGIIATVNSLATQASNTIALAAMMAMLSCGTQIETGRNGTRVKPKDTVNGPKGNDDEKKSENGSASCFASSGTGDESFLTQVCAALPEAEKQDFSKLYEALCVKKSFQNLFLPECGWNGKDGKPLAYQKIIEHTPLADTSETSFYFHSVYSLTIKKPTKSLKELLFLAFSQPELFRKNYIFPKNIQVKPHTRGVFAQDGADALQFEMHIGSGAGATKFLNEIRGYELKDDVQLVTEKMIKAFDATILLGKNLQVAVPLKDGRYKIVVIEEYRVPDRGLHDIARSLLIALDVNRMKLIVDNAEL